jgi:adenine-specific DNA methylase
VIEDITIFPFSDGFELVLILYKDAIVSGLFLLMGVRSGILGDCSSSFNTSRSLTKYSFHVNPEDLMNHKEATKSRQKLDSKSEESLFLSALTIFPFSDGFELVLILYKDAIVGGLF